MKVNINIKKKKVDIKHNKSDVWSLDVILAHIIAESVKNFKEKTIGTIPGNLTQEEWINKLEEIYKTFDYVRSEGDYYIHGIPKELEIGFDYFKEYFSHLWV